MSGPYLVRTSPPDRRAPIEVRRGTCTQGESCFCCPGAASSRGHRNCNREHPPRDRTCSPPYPSKMPACKEREALPQQAPAAPPGFYTPNQACCVDCGRVTARRWADPQGRWLPWCAGEMPAPRRR